MKRYIRKLTAIAFISALSSITMTSHADVGDISVGAKFGMTHNTSEPNPGVSSKNEAAFGLNLGYEFAPNWTAELEYVKGSLTLSNSTEDLTIDFHTISAFAAYRSSGDLYLLGRLGIVNFGVDSGARSKTTDTGETYSIGAGYKLMPNLNVELDYTLFEKETNWATLSARYYFR